MNGGRRSGQAGTKRVAVIAGALSCLRNMEQNHDEKQGASKTAGATVILGWDEVFGLHLQVRGGQEEARRVAEFLTDREIEARADAEGTDRLRRDGFERVMLCEAGRNAENERELRGLLFENGCAVEPTEGVETVDCPYGERLLPLLRRGSYFDDPKPLSAAELGLGAEADGPELLRLAADREFDFSWLSDAVWAPVWAWLLLGELKPPGTTELLLALLNRLEMKEGDDAASEVLPKVFGRIGHEVAPALTAVLRDESRPISPRWAAVSGLANIAVAWPEARSEVVGILTAQLEEQAVWDAGVNGMIVDALIQLDAVESAAAIERAFQAKRVDETITGDWDDVQVELGLKEAPEFVPGIGLYGSLPVRREGPKVGRNDPCPCGSGKKFKKCCGG